MPATSGPLAIQNLDDFVTLVGELLVFVLLPCLAAILHFHPELKCRLQHGILLLIVFDPIVLRLEVPLVKPSFGLSEDAIIDLQNTIETTRHLNN
jgi:hypothetical protein